LYSCKPAFPCNPIYLSKRVPRTKGEVGPLQLALLAVIGGLVDGSRRRGVCYGLLQKRVGADRSRSGRVVEESDDILLSGLIPGIEVSSTFLKTTKTQTAMSRADSAQMGVARLRLQALVRLANTSLNRFLKKLILTDLVEV